MREWLWREMAKVARAGAEGLPAAELFGSAHLYLVEGHPVKGNRPYLTSVRTWIRYTPYSYDGKPYPYQSSRPVTHYHFTEEGRAHYVEHGPAYREWYPDIDAPELDSEGPSVPTAGGPGGT